jgi:hypothetical protein
MLGELLPMSDKMIDHFKGDKDMEKELNQEETEQLYCELLNHYQ